MWEREGSLAGRQEEERGAPYTPLCWQGIESLSHQEKRQNTWWSEWCLFLAERKYLLHLLHKRRRARLYFCLKWGIRSGYPVQPKCLWESQLSLATMTWRRHALVLSTRPLITRQLQHVFLQALGSSERVWGTQGEWQTSILRGLAFAVGQPLPGPPSSRCWGNSGRGSPAWLGFSTQGDSDGCVHQSCNLVAITTGHILCSLGTPRLVYDVWRLL